MTKFERMKEILKASPNFGKRVGYKMCVVDELHDIKELEKINADLKQSLDWANEREKELKAQIEKMKCCENCIGTCNSDDVARFCKDNKYKLWETKENGI